MDPYPLPACHSNSGEVTAGLFRGLLSVFELRCSCPEDTLYEDAQRQSPSPLKPEDMQPPPSKPQGPVDLDPAPEPSLKLRRCNRQQSGLSRNSRRVPLRSGCGGFPSPEATARTC